LSVKIRLHRAGQKGRPFYKVVVADSRSPRDGRFIEMLGYYDPVPKTTLLDVNAERIDFWMKRGAKPTDTVRNLIKRASKFGSTAGVAEAAREVRAKRVEEANKLAPRRPAPEPKKADGAAKPDAKAEAKAAPKPAPKPAPSAEAKAAPTPDAKAAPKPEAKAAPKKAEAKPEAPKAEAPKPEAKAPEKKSE